MNPPYAYIIVLYKKIATKIKKIFIFVLHGRKEAAEFDVDFDFRVW